jgi:flavin reductase (DIM6/NTAB) family NADH-FMN oxidoreductase RutF
MTKKLMGPLTLIYPAPALLIGANVNTKPNFMTAAWGGIANSVPPMVSISLRHNRFTFQGVKQNFTFSVNIPSLNQVKETDFCGIRSGSKVDKVSICKFKVFYGKLGTAPLIEQCPVNLECKVVHMLNLGSHMQIIGRIEETYVSENCLTNGKPDVNLINPILYLVSPAQQYVTYGEVVGKGHCVGQELFKNNPGTSSEEASS